MGYQIRHLIIISALEIKQEEIDCVSSKKKSQSNARNARPIPIKNDRTSVTKRKKSIEKLFALFCSCEFVLVINLSRQKKTKKHPKVTLKMVFEGIKHDLEYVY